VLARREHVVVGAVFAVLLALGTWEWQHGREDHGTPTADLHADSSYYYVYLPSLLGGDLDFTDEYDETHDWYHLADTPTGRHGNVFGIGPAVFTAPLFLLGHGLAFVFGSRQDGFSDWEIRLYTWSSVLASLAAVFFAYRLVRRRLGGGALAIAGPIVAALAGPVVYYATRQPGYAHPFATLFGTWLVERWDASYDGPRTLRTWLGLGALFGAAVLARPQLGLWGVLLAAAAVDDWRTGWQPRLALRWLAAAATALVVFAPQLLAWRALYGSWYLVPQGPGFMRWDSPCWSEVLFSSRNGLFPWSPAYLVFGIAAIVAVRKLPRLVVGLGVGFALQTVSNGAVWDWWGGGAFGGRRFDSTYVCFAFGAAVIVAWLARVVPPAIERPAPWRARVVGASAALFATLVGLVVVANIRLAIHTTVTSARIFGGEQAAPFIRSEAHGLPGFVAEWASALSNLPARALFAWRYDTDLAGYDLVVGVYALGETFPGLNPYPDQVTDTISVKPSPFVAGAVRHKGGVAVGPDGRVRILVELNREGGVELRVALDGSGRGRVLWNDELLVEQAIGPGVMLDATAHTIRRGTNELVIEAPPGSGLHPIAISAIR